MRSGALALLLIAGGLRAETGVGERIAAQLPRLRASREDLDVRPGRWDTRLTSPAIESLLADPLSLPERSERWGQALGQAEAFGSFESLAESLLGLPTEPSVAPATAAVEGLPPRLSAAVSDLAGSIARARRFLVQASAAFAPKERARLLAAFQRQLAYGAPEPIDGALFDEAGRFDEASLLQAVRIVAESVDRAAPALAGVELKGAPRRFVLDGSTVTIGGSGDDEYAGEDLTSDILIDLGGRNRYHGAPAAAGPGEIRVVLDLGSEAVVDSSGPVASGMFGIGVLDLPNGAGPKRLRAGAFSLGTGLFGAGLLRARGPEVRLESGDVSQGAAAFGVGLAAVEGAGAVLEASYSAQGFASTRGVGLLRVRGDRARLRCGLVYPDAREPLAAISLCQGTGYGPRAFAAGGFGLARLDSSDARAEASYFAQGSGYWHSFGGFWVSGDRARVVSRRYGQGAGVHTALGAFMAAGDEDRVVHWGVGPGYGWDYGVGLAAGLGRRGEWRADWGAGRGDVNGHGFLVLSGEGSRLQLADLGTGALKRSGPSYGVAVVDDPRARLAAPRLSSATPVSGALQPSAWGTVELSSGAALDPSVDISSVSWPTLEAARAEEARRDRERNVLRLQAAERLEPRARVAAELFVAASGGLEGRTPEEALERLLALDDRSAEALVALLSPDRFDELALLRVLVPAYGPRLAAALRSEIAGARGLRKAVLVGSLRGLPGAAAFPVASKALKDPDPRVRREALAILGSLLDRQEGEEPGRVRFLEETEALCARADPSAPLDAGALARLGWKRPADLLAALSLLPSTGAEERIAVLRHSPNLFDPVPADTLQAWIAALARSDKACARTIERELTETRALESRARKALLEAAEDPSLDTLPVALAALGQIGRPEDAPRVAAGLSSASAAVREAAAVGLARMGPAGRGAIERALGDTSPLVRSLGAVAAAQSWDSAIFRLLERALADRDAGVRETAVGALDAAQSTMSAVRKELVPRLQGLAADDPSPSVRASAAWAAASYR